MLCALQHLLQLVVHEMNLGADDHLARVLAGTDDTGSTSGLDSLLVHLGVILDLKAQTACAVTNFLHVLLAADSSPNLVHDVEISVASNPEFLAQGTAVRDTIYASRIVIMGYACAIGVVLALIIAIFSAIQFKVAKTDN